MLYIGFSLYSHKLHSRIFCHKYKHCAPVIIRGENAIIYQFVRINKVTEIHIRKKDLDILRRNGWTFIAYNKNKTLLNMRKRFFLTCVQYTKHFCNIKAVNIQTPDALLKYIHK